jgi:hypothetical protein
LDAGEIHALGRDPAFAELRWVFLTFGETEGASGQPRKLAVEEGTGLGGGFARRRPWRDGPGRRRHLGAAISLIAGVGSATTCSVACIKENPGETPMQIDLRARMETANPRGKPELLWQLFTHSPTPCSGYRRERLVPESLFCTAPPRKLGGEGGTGCGGGFARA